MKRSDRVIIIGAGMGGIAAAVRLSALGYAVDV
jgi:phytoene dehydrogenase-like protein